MAVSMSQISIPVFVRRLNGLANCLKKAQAFYSSKGYDETTLVNYRFFPDMFNSRSRVFTVTSLVSEPSICAGLTDSSQPTVFSTRAMSSARLFSLSSYLGASTPASIAVQFFA